MWNSGSSTSSGRAKGKEFFQKLQYVQHVDKDQIPASEISELTLRDLLADRKVDGHLTDDSNLTENLANPESNLDILKSFLKDRITEVVVCSNPLPISLVSSSPRVMFHAFVVFATRNTANSQKEMWWSLEKNGNYIVLQQSTNRDDVVDKLYDTEKKRSVERHWKVITFKKSARGNFEPLGDLLQVIWETNQIIDPYHFLFSNCQHFASLIFEKSNGEGKKWSPLVSDQLGQMGDRFWERKNKTAIEVNAVMYNFILNDDKFDYYKAMMEGRREDFEQLTNNLTIECLNSVDTRGYTLLEWATVFSSSDWPIDEELKKKGAQIPLDEKLFKQNVFFIALQYLPPNQNSKFLSFDGIDIHGVNKTGDTALHLALYGEKWGIAEEILRKFEDIDANKTNSLRDTPLHLAAKLKCEIDLFTKILNRTNSGNVNKVDGNGCTALHYAIDNKFKTKVEELLNHKDVDVNVQNLEDNSTALHLASNWPNIPSDLFNLIIQKSKNINAQDIHGWTALQCAIFSKSELQLKKLLAHKDAHVNVNVKNVKNQTALHCACIWWTDIPIHLFKQILEKTTDKNAQDDEGWTALHYILIDVDVQNNQNCTALHYKSRWKDIPIDLVKLILENDKILKKISDYLRNDTDKLLIILKFLIDYDKQTTRYWTVLRSVFTNDVAFNQVVHKLAQDTQILENDPSYLRFMADMWNNYLTPNVGVNSQRFDFCLVLSDYNFMKTTAIRAAIFNLILTLFILDSTWVEVIELITKLAKATVGTSWALTLNNNFKNFLQLTKSTTTNLVSTGLETFFFLIFYEAVTNLIFWRRGDISGRRCSKNIIDSFAGMAAGVGGGIFGATAGSYIVNGFGLMAPTQFMEQWLNPTQSMVDSTPMEMGSIIGAVIFGVASAMAATKISDWLTQKLFNLPKDVAVDNAHKFLGLEYGASNDEINSNFWRLALKYHPDKGGSSDDWHILQYSVNNIKLSKGENRQVKVNSTMASFERNIHLHIPQDIYVLRKVLDKICTYYKNATDKLLNILILFSKEKTATEGTIQILRTVLDNDEAFLGMVDRLVEKTEKLKKDENYHPVMAAIWNNYIKPNSEYVVDRVHRINFRSIVSNMTLTNRHADPRKQFKQFFLAPIRHMGQLPEASATYNFIVTLSCLPQAAQDDIVHLIMNAAQQVAVYPSSLELLNQCFNNLLKVTTSSYENANPVGLMAVFLTWDIWNNLRHWWNGEITGEQYAKNIINSCAGAAGGVAGGYVGAKVGSCIAPGIGTVVGAVIGGVAGSALSYSLSQWLTEYFFKLSKEKTLIEAYKFLKLNSDASVHEINESFERLANEYNPNIVENRDNFEKLQYYMSIIKLHKGEF